MLSYFAKDITEDTHFSRAVAKLWLMIEIFDAPTIHVKVDCDTPTRAHHDPVALLEVAKKQDKVIEDAAKLLHISSYKELKQK